jgi:flagellar biosynthesis GTPase FlhF
MKVFSIAFALVALASSAPLGAQISTNRLPTTNRGVSVDGSWRVVGRDGNGNTIYERRTQDQYGNIIVQRARRDRNGNMTIISSNTVGNNGNNGNNGNRGNRNCDYNRSTNSIGDIIFGRTNDVNCDDNGSRVDGGWYQVGRGRDNSSIYERRTRDRNGNLVIQRARRNSNGTFTILNTRSANDNDKQWQKEQKRQEKEWKKQQHQDKEWQKHQDEAWKKQQHQDQEWQKHQDEELKRQQKQREEEWKKQQKEGNKDWKKHG